MKLLLKICIALFALASSARANTSDPATAAEVLRSSLAQAQIELVFDAPTARELLLTARIAYQNGLNQLGQADFAPFERAINASSERQFAKARAELWTGVLSRSYAKLERAIEDGDLSTAKTWLNVREYRAATRFTTPETDATLALEALGAKTITNPEALTAVRADLLDAYQARLSDALFEVQSAIDNDYRVIASENAALARGYFAVLEPFYPKAKLESALASFETLKTTPNSANLERVRTVLEGFRAAPLSPRERAKRAAQVMRFLSLVQVEYDRGVKQQNGIWSVVKDLEITEASTFLANSRSAFTDLEPLLIERDRAAVQTASKGFAELETKIKRAATKTDVPSSDEVRQTSAALTAQLEALIPPDWRRADPAGDLDVIRQQLKAMENAAASGQFDIAEAARIDAYALLESGPEARLKVFKPELALELESLFWHNPALAGFAKLINEKASASEFRESRVALEAKLKEASRIVGTDASPLAVFTNALVIVFREGLEAVLILAALLGSLKRREVRHLRKPLWLGAVASFGATIVTFMIMRSIVNAFASFGERLEVIVSLVAIGVLLLIMNWFFHQVYWNEHLASFHKQKHQLAGVAVGQTVGLFLLGFTALYREGFETALFLQSLVLQSDVGIVTLGSLAALVLVVIIGTLVFVAQTKLPHKKMLVFTGLMMCVVLGMMVGNTVHKMQIVGWMPIHPLPVTFPNWLGMWLGTYATLEGIALQVIAVTAVIGSYFLAESMKHKEMRLKAQQATN